ncbi:hypothetical protein FM036_19485 [Nostoc sp. HG1]|nr:hypothetical protein [Nostoc sp. HG1]MCL6751240.1 hypothetical protein [Nostoc sp. CCCryo 231-06]
MESTLFTTLTVTEEASLSGGTHPKKHKPAKPPAKPKPFVLNQLALNVLVGAPVGSTVDQVALNVAEGAPAGATVTQTAVNVFTATK